MAQTSLLVPNLLCGFAAVSLALWFAAVVGVIGGTQGNLEMVSALPSDVETRWSVWSEPALAGPGSDRGQLWGMRTRAACVSARTSVPSVWQRGGGAGSRNPGRPVPSLRAATWALTPEPLWAPLRPQPVVSPRLCGDHRGGHQGTVVTGSPGILRWRNCALWSPQSLLSRQRDSFSSECYECSGF